MGIQINLIINHIIDMESIGGGGGTDDLDGDDEDDYGDEFE